MNVKIIATVCSANLRWLFSICVSDSTSIIFIYYISYPEPSISFLSLCNRLSPPFLPVLQFSFFLSKSWVRAWKLVKEPWDYMILSLYVWTDCLIVNYAQGNKSYQSVIILINTSTGIIVDLNLTYVLNGTMIVP